MLNYIESEKYRRDPNMLVHFILIAICLAIISVGALIYFC